MTVWMASRCESGEMTYFITMLSAALACRLTDATLLSVQVSPSMELLGFVFAGSAQKGRCLQEDNGGSLNVMGSGNLFFFLKMAVKSIISQHNWGKNMHLI